MAYNNTAYGNGGPTNYPNAVPVYNVDTNPFGFIEVGGFDGVNRFPVAPGAGVNLKDANSDLVFVKARDSVGNNLPLRVFRMMEVTDEYMQNEEPVTRKEFKQLQSAIGEVKELLEFLTGPSAKEANDG